MILLDSSIWISYLIENHLADVIEKYFLKPESLIVPTLVIYEVYRHLLRQIPEEEAVFLITQMQAGLVVPFDENVSLQAAELSLKYKLGTADSVIYATALRCEAKMITLDNDFRSLPQCQVIG